MMEQSWDPGDLVIYILSFWGDEADIDQYLGSRWNTSWSKLKWEYLWKLEPTLHTIKGSFMFATIHIEDYFDSPSNEQEYQTENRDCPL